jgi:transcriptional regulator with XRE-family HTH domain
LIRTKLVEFRGERSQDEMGSVYGVTQQSWSYWERGIKTPSPTIMKRIATDSGVSMEIIFFDVFNNRKLLQYIKRRKKGA